jgi:hypothetical protein
MPRSAPSLLASCLLLSFVLACDKGDASSTKKADAPAAKQADAPAKQDDKPPPPDPAAELAAKIDALALIPAELPATIEAACDAMAEQLDLLNQAKLTGDDLTKWNTGGKEGVLTPAKGMCVQRGSIPEAACAAAGMKAGGVEIEPHIGDLMAACAKKAGAAPK